METVRIRLQISRDAAIRAGHNQYGWTVVPIDVAALSPDEREELLKCRYDSSINVFEPFYLTNADQQIAGCTDLTLPAVADASLASIKTLLTVRRAAIIARGNDSNDQVEILIKTALAEPDEKWFSEGATWCNINAPVGFGSYEVRRRAFEDARIAARCQQLEPIAKAREEAKKLAVQQRRDSEAAAAYRHATERKAWIAEHGSTRLQRLAAAGIEHANRYENERLAKERPDWRWLTDDMSTNEPDDDCPPEALDLLDAVMRDTSIASPQLRLISNDDEQFYAVLAEFLGRAIVTKQSIEA